MAVVREFDRVVESHGKKAVAHIQICDDCVVGKEEQAAILRRVGEIWARSMQRQAEAAL